jgi:ankyrin repeat protein
LTNHGHNILHIAASHGHAVLLIYFIRELKMDIYATDKKGRSPLHLAAHEGQPITLIILISMYENIDLKDNFEMTPLHYATLSNEIRVIKHLLLNGASRECLDFEQKRPIDLLMTRN